MGELAEGVGPFAQPALAPEPVDRPVAGRRRDPGAGVVGDAVGGPALQRDRERLLHGLLGEVEVAEDADERRDRPSRLAPEQAVDDLVLAVVRADLVLTSVSMIGRTSMEPSSAPGTARGRLDRLVEVLGLDHVVPAELLLRLGEGAVGGRGPAVAHPDGRGLLGAVESVACLEQPLLLQPLGVLAVPLELLRPELLLLLGGEAGPGLLVAVDQQHVLHGSSLLGGSGDLRHPSDVRGVRISTT